MPARWRRRLVVASFLAPWMVGFAVFQLGPVVATLVLSFTRYDALASPEWIGLRNYEALGSDQVFWQSVRNTLWWVFLAVPAQVVFATLAAALLSPARRGVAVHRTIALLPVTIPIVAGTIAFTLLLNPAHGAVNQVLGAVGLPEPLWFFDESSSKPALLLLALWGSGTSIIVLLASIQHVPRSLYEAADVDGAGRLGRFRHVTLPMVAPVLAFTTIVGVLQAFQYFSQPYVASTVTGASLGSPQGSTLFYPSWLFRQGFQAGRFGYAAAMGWVLFLVALAIVTGLLAWSRRVGVGVARR
jgi:multiple sugar transport system permease protein